MHALVESVCLAMPREVRDAYPDGSNTAGSGGCW
jgi:hypothetical protein